MGELKLASEFPAVSRAEWMKRVEAVLKGAAFEDKLVHTSADGIRLEPIYGQLAAGRAPRAPHVPGPRVPRNRREKECNARAGGGNRSGKR